MSSDKVSRILQILLVAFLAIGLRSWHLAVVQRDQLLLEADKPKRRVLIEQPERGLLYDRFGIPLALNKICYKVTLTYGEIAQIPAVSWQEEGGKRVKTHPRRLYVKRLSELLAKELSLDPDRIQDLIYAKASLFPHTPFPLKTHLTETEYYRLRAIEREWAGLHAEIGSCRAYPLEKTACHLVGTLGAISGDEYGSIAQELSQLQEAIDLYEEDRVEWLPPGYLSLDQVYERYAHLRERAYTLNDLIGKSGLEAQFEEALRGVLGKHIYEIDHQGHLIRELPGGRPTRPGTSLQLSLSAELQQFAEELLARDEADREGRSSTYDPETKSRKVLQQPWMKGGAIVALDPNTGEVLAMASYPRFDPNDFVPTQEPALRREQNRHLNRWFETPSHIAALWDGLEPLIRERANGIQTQEITWDFFLSSLFPEGPLRTFWSKCSDIKTASQLQEDFETLRYFAKVDNPLPLLFPSSKKEEADPALLRLLNHYADVAPAWSRVESLLKEIPTHEGRSLLVDLCRLAVYSPAFSDALLKEVGHLSLSIFHSLSQERAKLEDEAKRLAFDLYHKRDFATWRTQNQTAFLAARREEEKQKKTYARPYLDYLDKQERGLFSVFWQEARLPLLSALVRGKVPEEPLLPYWEHLTASLSGSSSLFALRRAVAPLSDELTVEFLRTMRSFQELDRPLIGKHRHLKTERDLAASFYPRGGFGYCRSSAFQTSAPLGSLFKIVTGAEAIRQKETTLSSSRITPDLINPLTLVDRFAPSSHERGPAVAFSLDGSPFFRQYKGGRLPKSTLPNIGRIDLVGALEQSSNPYFAILAGDFLSDPEDLAKAALHFGFGARTGLGLPGEATGKIPSDLKENKTGLYSFAIGQHTFLATPLQASLMLASVANGGHLLQPYLAIQALSNPTPPAHQPLWKEELSFLGLDFSPLSLSPTKRTSSLSIGETHILRTLPLSKEARHLLLQGLDRVIWGAKGSARPSHIRGLISHPLAARDYLSLEHQMVGKTSTAEIRIQPTSFSPPELYKHIWFGAVSFEPGDRGRFERAELVVVVMLRYGDSGKEAAPLAAQVVRKWREIKALHQM